VHHPKELQQDEYDGDNDQNVNPAAGARKAWTDVPAEKAKQPKYDKNHNNCPQHEISPLSMIDLNPPGRLTIRLSR
jgi:hypothetical protein